MVGISAQECADSFIRHWVTWAGCPQHIFTDRGTQFTSALWKELCNYLGSELHHSTAYHPQAQGLVERFNRTLKASLKCYENPSEWYDHLPWVLLALRNSPKDDLANSTPNFILYGESIRLPGEFFEDSVDDYQEPTQAFTRNLAQYAATLSYKPPRHVDRKSFIEKALFAPQTSHVYIRVDSHRPPLRPAYKGPYRVLEKNKKHFLIDFHTCTDRVSIDRLKAAHLSIDTLNNHLTLHEPNTHTPQQTFVHTHITPGHAFDEFTQETLNTTQQHLTTRHGRPVRKPAHFNDYVRY